MDMTARQKGNDGTTMKGRPWWGRALQAGPVLGAGLPAQGPTVDPD
jgi:hypothetical protein